MEVNQGTSGIVITFNEYELNQHDLEIRAEERKKVVTELEDEAAKTAGVDFGELYTQTEEYFKAKMARKEYHKYKYNKLAQERLYADCLQETLLSKLSLKGKLSLAFGKEG